MTKELRTTIEQIEAAPGQRLLVVSDIHGHFNRLVQLLKKLEYGGDDILIIVGDLIDKGPESLRVVQYVMDLSRRHPVYVSMGNVDFSRLLKLEEDGASFAGFLKWSAEWWKSSLFQEMLADLGVSVGQVTAENAPEYQERIREQFREELDFLRNRPAILTAGNYLFVHGGVPTEDLDVLAREPARGYLKNDNFWNQGYSFQKFTVVTGHWPTGLYRKDRVDVSPLFDPERNIVCIDGGCGLKRVGQLNGIIIPDCRAGMEELSWTSYDDFPVATALEAGKERPAAVRFRYFDSAAELLEERYEMALVRQLSSGKETEVPRSLLSRWDDGLLHCDDYSDEWLAVEPGEELSVLFETQGKRYVKKRGEVGWYAGAVKPGETGLKLVQGGPESGNWRRERELAVYELLNRLGIPFERIDHCEANTMETCRAIDEALNAVICKNLFLCNQQRTKFYLLVMPGDKRFRTKELSKQINSSRLSFGEAVYMERFLHISPGSVSVMGLMNDTENRVQLLIDREILAGERFGCHPCMNTSSIRLSFADLLEKFLPAVRHEPVFVELVR